MELRYNLAMSTTSIPLLISERDASFLELQYQHASLPVPNENMSFYAKVDGCTISIYKKIYEDKKRKVLFQGVKAEEHAKRFGYKPEPVNVNVGFYHEPNIHFGIINQIGSDEVGTGDFFGPIVVCAAYVDEEGARLAEKLKLTDSKQMDDAYIRQIGAEVSLAFDHSLLVLRNEKFNEVHKAGTNMNAMKAKMHNQCLYNVLLRHDNAFLYQDEFAEPELYYHYLKDENVVVRGIHFAPRAESKWVSVAVASVIARYAFLCAMDKLSIEFGEPIPLGAGPKVDAFALRQLNQKGLPFLQKAVKMNFSNYKRLTEKA